MDDIVTWLSTLFTPDAAADAGGTSGWGSLLEGLSDGARGLMEGIAEGAKMITSIDLTDTGDSTGPADVARLDTHPDELAGAASGWSDSGPGSQGWFSKMLGEIDSKTKVAAVGGGLSAVGTYLAKGKSDKIAEEHYKRQDETAQARLLLEQQKQSNAATSGANLNVKGLIGSPQYQNVPGGYNDRRKRNLIAGV